MKIPEIFDDLGEYLYDDIRTLGRILQHNCLVLRTAWLHGWACDNLERCQIMSDTILNTLLAAGFLPNYDKSIFTPVQSIDWLGFTNAKRQDGENIIFLYPVKIP
jgi:hypothetical protein